MSNEYFDPTQQAVATVVCCYIEHYTEIQKAKASVGVDATNIIAIGQDELTKLIDAVQKGFKTTE